LHASIELYFLARILIFLLERS